MIFEIKRSGQYESYRDQNAWRIVRCWSIGAEVVASVGYSILRGTELGYVAEHMISVQKESHENTN